MKEMVGGCCVCSDERGWPENPLVYCDGQNCTVAVHQACYGIVTVPTGPWFCRKCESQERSTRVRCELCPSRDGALKKTDNQGWAHVVCALYIPEVRFGNVTTMEPIILQLIPQERYGKNCYICQDLNKPHRATVGACMQCNKSNCKQQFHVTCAQSLGLLCEEAGNYLDNVKYCGYCQHHYSKLKKGGNVKTIPPYKPIAHDTSSDSGSSPEKEIESMSNTASSTSAISIKISTNLTSSSSTSSKQRKSSNATKQSSTASSNAITGNLSSSSSSIHNLSNTIAAGLTGTATTHSNHNPANPTSSSTGFSGSNPLTAIGAGTNLSTNLKSSTGSSSSGYKDGKDSKHSKNMSKISSSGKDKDKDKDSYSSFSSRDSRDKSSKSSKNKDITPLSSSSNSQLNTNLSATISSSSLNAPNPFSVDHTTGVHNFSTNNSNSISFSQSNPGNISSSTSAKDSSKILFSHSSNFISELHSDGANLTTAPIDIISTSNNSNTTNLSANFNKNSNNSQSNLSGSNNHTTSSSVNLHLNNTSNSSSSSFAKKRKNDPKLNASDEVNSSFRDIIKDVTVTLTPLTDFEKEIEKSSKKQKTELSPPTHQSSINTETSSQNSREAVLISTTPNVHTSSNNVGNQSSSHHKASASDGKYATAVTTTSSAHKTAPSPSNSISAKEREERYAAAQAAIAAANGGSVTTITPTAATTTASSSSATGSAPSLYVSVPLSTANVPGINIPTNTASTEHTIAQSTRSTSQQQQLSASSSTTVGNNSLDRLSPYNATATSSSSTSISSPAAPQHGVIYQSGKSPNTTAPLATSSSSSSTGINLTASTTETGNLKISYEKQSSRLSQIQGQESAPIRRSRTPDSGVFSSSSFNVSNASTASSCSSSSLIGSGGGGGGGGLKFSYEAQSGASSLSASIDTNLAASTTIKDSPPSSPCSEAGSQRKRGRKAKDLATISVSTSSSGTNLVHVANDLKDIKVFQNGAPLSAAPPTSSAVIAAAAAVSSLAPSASTITSSTINVSSAAHMLGNQINPNSSVAQKLSDQLSMEIQDHNIYSADPLTPQFVGVPFPGKMRNSSTPSAAPISSAPPGPSPLASMFGSGANGNLAIPQSLEQLLERQWEQGSQFLMEQAQHFDIASLLSCLHQLQTENVRLEEHVSSLIARRDHLLAVNARLAIPLNTNTTQSQVTTTGGSISTTSAIQASTSTINATPTLTTASAATAASLATAATTSISATTSSSTSRVPTGAAPLAANERIGRLASSAPTVSGNLENGLDFRQSSNNSLNNTAGSGSTMPPSAAMRHGASASATSQLAPTGAAAAQNSSSNNSNGGSTKSNANMTNMLPAMPSSSSLASSSNVHAATASSAMPPATASANRLQHQQQQQQHQQLHHMHHQQQQQQQHSQQHHHMQHAASSMHQPPQHQQQQQQHHHTHLSSHSTAHATHAIHHEPHPMTTSRIGVTTKTKR